MKLVCAASSNRSVDQRCLNLARIIREGVANPVHHDAGFMAAFGGQLDERKTKILVDYIRSSTASLQSY